MSSLQRIIVAPLIVCCCFALSVVAQHNSSAENETDHDHEEIGCPVESLTTERFKVAHFDFDYVSTPLIVALWVLFVSVAKVAFHASKVLSKLFPESCILILVGVVLGVILYFADKTSDHQLQTRTFFLLILPPIIIDAGYFMPSRAFFDQFGTIILFAVFGTLINTFMIGFSLWGVGLTGVFGDSVCLPLLHALVFASLLAAVDPVAVLAVFESIHVNQVLYIIVFGEALLNDGISVVLYHMFEGFTLIGSDNIQAVDIIAGVGSFFVIVIGAPAIGILLGFFGGFLSRFTHHVRIMEPLIVIVICYLSFLLCEMFHLSGILGCTFCGITMRKYVEANISEKSQLTIKYVMKMMASATEAIIFMYLGVAAVSNERVWNTAFILLTLVFCLVYRVIGIIIQAFLANRVRLTKMTVTDQFVMSFGGLRGAIAFALSALLEKEVYKSRDLMITATIVVVYFTNLVLGTLVEPLIKLLKVKREHHADPLMNEKIANRMLDHLMIAVEGITLQRGHNMLRERFSQFNNSYLKPFLIGRRPHRKQHVRGRGSEIFRVYRQLHAKDAKRLSRHPSSAASLHRWKSSISAHLDSLGAQRNYSQYELPDYWRGSMSNMSECDLKSPTPGANGSRVYTIPMKSSTEAHRQAASTCERCQCACHSTSNGTADQTTVTSPADLITTYESLLDDQTRNTSEGRSVTSVKHQRSSRAQLRDLDHSAALTFSVNGSSKKPTTTDSASQSKDVAHDVARVYTNFGYTVTTSDETCQQNVDSDVIYRF